MPEPIAPSQPAAPSGGSPAAPSPSAPSQPQPSAPLQGPQGPVDFKKQFEEVWTPHQQELKRGLGQIEALKKQLAAMEAAQKKAAEGPISADYEKLADQERAQLDALIKASWTKQFGEEWGRYSSMFKESEALTRANKITSSVRDYLGEEFTPEMENTVVQLYREIKTRSQNGDEEAKAIFDEIWKTKSGAFWLADQAKRYLAQQTASKAAEAGAAQDQRIKKSGSPGTSPAPKAPPAPNTSDEILKRIMQEPDRKKRLKMLEEHVPHEADRAA